LVTTNYDIAVEMERVMGKNSLSQKGIYPNVDFYSGLVYRKLEIPTDLFTPFAIIELAGGWHTGTIAKTGFSVLPRFTAVFMTLNTLLSNNAVKSGVGELHILIMLGA